MKISILRNLLLIQHQFYILERVLVSVHDRCATSMKCYVLLVCNHCAMCACTKHTQYASIHTFLISAYQVNDLKIEIWNVWEKLPNKDVRPYKRAYRGSASRRAQY